VSPSARPRLFLDSNVIVGGIVARWGLDKAILSICAARICRLVLADAVRDEVERNLARHALRLSNDKTAFAEAFAEFLRKSAPEVIAFPNSAMERANRGLIRHQADLPILLSAMAAKPDWLLTNNTKHFTQAIAMRTGLRITTPAEFLRDRLQTLR
jgi:predicted nucleic acid-binding protein